MKYKLFAFFVILILLAGTTNIAFADDPTPEEENDGEAKSEGNFQVLEVEVPTALTPKLTPILSNGNFESGPTNWLEYDNYDFPLVTTISGLTFTPRSGSWLAWLGGVNDSIGDIWQQNITIGTTTYLNLWYRIASVEPDCSAINSFSHDFAYVYVYSNPILYLEHYIPLCSANNSSGWVELNLNLGADYSGQTVTLGISIDTDSHRSSSLFIDDVSLYTTFADVPNGTFPDDYIQAIYDAGITGGCGTSPLKYCPNGTVTRSQMAIFLMRGINGAAYDPPDATGTVFNDVPIGSFGADFIEAFSTAGITGGCGGGSYCPDGFVTRGQMAIFLLRAKHGSSYTPPAATGTMFTDVPLSYPFVAWIEQLATEGITGGCGGGNYCPDSPVTRAQMAVFIQRTFSLTMP